MFREVAGDHADYFSGMEPSDLAQSIVNWLALYDRESHHRSEGMPWLTWADSVDQLRTALFGEAAYRTWL